MRRAGTALLTLQGHFHPSLPGRLVRQLVACRQLLDADRGRLPIGVKRIMFRRSRR
jgi:hypothetical protein